VKVALKNVLDRPIKVTIKGDTSAGSHWKLTPQVQSVSLKAHEERQFQFAATVDGVGHVYPPANLSITIEMLDLPKRIYTRSVVVPIKAFRTARCCQVESPVEIDGRLDDLLWQGCEVLAGFVTSDAQHKAEFPTEVRLVYDDDNLYVSFRCSEPNLNGLVINAKRRDQGNICDDDSVEIFIDTNLDRQT